MTGQSSWWKNATIYEIYLRSFYDSDGDGIGDLNGIRKQLDYLSKLGVDAIWISPFFQSPCCDNGYDISNYEAIDPQYGTMDDFLALVTECHSRGIRVILDMVLNHTSNIHPWFEESQSSVSSKKRDWYIWTKHPNNWGAQFGGSAWHYDEKSGEYYLGLFSAEQPDLNWKNPVVRSELYSMMKRWAERGVDGFRLDVISLIAKPEEFVDGPLTPSGYSDFHPVVANRAKTHQYIRELRKEVFGPYGLLSIGEASAVTLEEALKYCRPEREELDMVFQFEHVGLDGSEEYKWTHQRLGVAAMKDTLFRWQMGLQNQAQGTLFWCNHDQPRIVSRLGDSGKYRERSAKMLTTWLYGMQGTAFVYQGQEIGMLGAEFSSKSDLRDIESVNAYDMLKSSGMGEQEVLAILNLKSRDNARTPMQWSCEANAGFSTGEPWIKLGRNWQSIHVADQKSRPDSVFSYYQRLLKLRKEESCFTNGSIHAFETPKSIVAYERCDEANKANSVIVLCNTSSETCSYTVPADYEDATILLGNIPDSDYLKTNQLAPYESLILKK